MEQQKCPCEAYLKAQLDPLRSGLPGKDVFKAQSLRARKKLQCRGHYGGCDDWDESSSEDEEYQTMNSLVFDFEKRRMVVADCNEDVPSADEPAGLDDPVRLWLELKREMQQSGFDYNTFRRYSVGLSDLLQVGGHSFHHAGGCGCKVGRRLKIKYDIRDFHEDTHATRVLLAVGCAERAFGRVLAPGDILIWTIYHGFAAL